MYDIDKLVEEMGQRGFETVIDEIKKGAIVRALEISKNHTIQAAELLGMKRTLMCFLRKKYGLPIAPLHRALHRVLPT